jgi:2-polyprenyl-3-methyl-5-hydroxy-6-metoxy-1,4-benzoquinol methylase
MINTFLKKLADSETDGSLANRFRKKRFVLFERLCSALPQPVKILDVGGTINYWEKMNFVERDGVVITVLNLQKEKVKYGNIRTVIGDARDLSKFSDKEFDIAFSNSVIEHVGPFEDQRKMANEMIRVGKHIYLQTPNYYFPLEPHFLFPFFQMLPVTARIKLVMNLRMGWSNKKIEDVEDARSAATSIRLLRKKELRELFPHAEVTNEKFFGLTKSFVLISL